MKHKKSPFAQGQEAFWDGKTEKDNPFYPNYDGVTELEGDAQQWHEGFREARGDAGREEYSG